MPPLPSYLFLKNLFFSVQSHQAPTIKQELPPSPAAACHSQPAVKTESSDGEEGRDQDEGKVNGERMKTPSGWKCVPCHARYTVREDFITHMAEQHGKVRKFTTLLLSKMLSKVST